MLHMALRSTNSAALIACLLVAVHHLDTLPDLPTNGLQLVFDRCSNSMPPVYADAQTKPVMGLLSTQSGIRHTQKANSSQPCLSGELPGLPHSHETSSAGWRAPYTHAASVPTKHKDCKVETAVLSLQGFEGCSWAGRDTRRPELPRTFVQHRSRALSSRHLVICFAVMLADNAVCKSASSTRVHAASFVR